jgi:hypothetical protein
MLDFDAKKPDIMFVVNNNDFLLCVLNKLWMGPAKL